MSWPLTQLPRVPGGALILPRKHKARTQAYCRDVSWAFTEIKYLFENTWSGSRDGGRRERLLEALCSIERFFHLKTEIKHPPCGYVAEKELCCWFSYLDFSRRWRQSCKWKWFEITNAWNPLLRYYMTDSNLQHHTAKSVQDERFDSLWKIYDTSSH